MRVIAVAVPEASCAVSAPMSIFLAGEEKVFKKKIYETKKGNYFMHNGRRVFFSRTKENDGWMLLNDAEPITMYVTMSDNYTATVRNIDSLRSYLETATWGPNVDENFGRITYLSGDSQHSSILLREVKATIVEYVQKFVEDSRATLEDFEGMSARMKRQTEKYSERGRIQERHTQLIWSIDQD